MKEATDEQNEHTEEENVKPSRERRPPKYLEDYVQNVQSTSELETIVTQTSLMMFLQTMKKQCSRLKPPNGKKHLDFGETPKRQNPYWRKMGVRKEDEP
jgi:hypothetical protein